MIPPDFWDKNLYKKIAIFLKYNAQDDVIQIIIIRNTIYRHFDYSHKIYSITICIF